MNKGVDALTEFIPVSEPLLNGNEMRYVLDCIETGWISSEGFYVERFEKEFAKKVNRNYGIAVSNGSVALELAVKALGITSGDEVILFKNILGHAYGFSGTNHFLGY